MDASLKNLTPLDRQLTMWVLAAFPFDTPEPAPGSTDDATWRALLERAKLQGLSPLLYASLEKHGFVNVPAFAVDALQEIYRKSALAAAVAHHEMETLVAQLAEQGIDVIVLKGAALSRWLYPQPSLRPFGDLDLLIHERDRAAARQTMVACGYQDSSGSSAAFRDTFYCEMLFTRAVPPRQSVDLHWNLLNSRFYRRRVNLDWFWAHTQSLGSGPVTARIFEPRAQLAHLALHLGLHHGNVPRLMHLYDLALLIHKCRAAIDWQAVAEYIQSAGLARPVHHVLMRTQTAWQIPLAPEVLAQFRPRIWHFSEHVAFRFITAVHNEGSVLTDALSVPGAKNKLSFALQHLFPDAAYMQKHYALAPDAFLPYYYARRLVASSSKFLRSLWSSFVR